MEGPRIEPRDGRILQDGKVFEGPTKKSGGGEDECQNLDEYKKLYEPPPPKL
jgi:hypothetical protein